MPPLKRPVPRATAPATEGVSFGDLSLYAAGGGLPEGDYALEFLVQMFQATSQAGVPKGPPRLGVMVTCYPLNSGEGEPRNQFYSMGRNADKSFAPNPETGKSVIGVPGGPASTFNDQTNWAVFLKSLYDSGLPQGIFTNDVSVLDGIHVHMANQPEPESRKAMRGKTGEAATEEPMGSGMIAVVTEIKEDGKPWEGTGGVPGADAPTPAPKPVAKVAGKIAPKKPTPAPAPVEAAADDDVEAAAVAGAAAVIEKNPNGVSKLLLRTGTFKEVTTQASPEMAQAVIETYFGTDDNLNVLLSSLGYGVQGQMVKPLA